MVTCMFLRPAKTPTAGQHTVDARPHVLHLETGHRSVPSAACPIHMPDAQAYATTGLTHRVHIVTSLALPLA